MAIQIYVVVEVMVDSEDGHDHIYVGIDRAAAFGCELSDLADRLIVEVWENGKQTERHSKEQRCEWRREW
jgi:hypothetical protein